jgi:hypothetical protein
MAGDTLMFVMRDESGEIFGVFASAQPGYAEEFVPTDDAELQEFYKLLNEPSA